MPRKKGVVVEVQTGSNTGQEENTIVQTKPKREKKTTKHKVVAVVTPDGIQGSFQSDVRRPLIAHLPIHSSDIRFNDQPLQYDPNPPAQPIAFDAGEIDPFDSGNQYVFVSSGDVAKEQQQKDEEKDEEHDAPVVSVSPQQPQQPLQQQSHVSQQPRKEYGPTTLLVQFASSKTTHELPSESKNACFWCCEQFAGRPCVIPMRIVDSVWHVYGNMCTPQCAMAYLLSELMDTHTRWERIALLNRLYGDNVTGRIYPAPARESLERFGGPIQNVDFRAMCEAARTRVDIHLPPMVSILASMDTKPIDFYETPLRNTFASPHQLPIVKQSEEQHGLKLKRTKPLKDKESTLDVCLQLGGRGV